MFKELINNITNKVNNIKEENNQYKELLKKTTIFQNLFPIPILSITPSEHKINTITLECPDINKNKANLIAKLIPTEETFIAIYFSKEILTNKEYYLIATNKYLWIINSKEFGAYPYTNFNCKIVKNNIMSKTILLNNILLEINGNDTKINNLISILNNTTYRESIIKEKTNYLCEIIPIYQNINSINSGISLDNNKNIIFHTNNQNYKCTTSDLLYYEILLDNSIIFSNKNNTTSKITTFQNNCYQITIRITLKNNQTIILPILEPNSFGTKYQNTDSIFQTNFNFAKELIKKIESLIPKNY